jgi:hypothetical protein
MKPTDLPHQPACAAWSNRILFLSLIGIGYLTLFPFQFHSAAFLPNRGIPFLLGSSGKKEGVGQDFFLNILLFVPIGFALSAEMRKWGKGAWKSFLVALALGAFVSYSVEFLQLYIPERDSGWMDVISNTTGSLAGYLLFQLFGGPVMEELRRLESLFIRWLSPRRAAALLTVYFAVCFGISALLQTETRLSDWDPRCVLLLGNDASGRNPWAGKVLLLQIWNRPLPEETVERIHGRESASDEIAGLLVNYDFKSSAPLEDQTKFLPVLVWTPAQPQLADAKPPEVSAKFWLSTQAPAENLARELKKTSQFTIRIVCAPASTERGLGRIISLSKSTDNVNFHLRQRGEDLVFFFRTPLSETRSVLAWTLPGVFKSGGIHDIVASYDGSDAFVYVDGKPAARAYRLSPGASLLHVFDYIQSTDLDGYVIVYNTLVFLPAGALLGLAAKKWIGRNPAVLWFVALGWAIPPVLLELLLAMQSGRRVWASNIGLSLVFSLAGMLYVNADRTSETSRAAEEHSPVQQSA